MDSPHVSKISENLSLLSTQVHVLTCTCNRMPKTALPLYKGEGQMYLPFMWCYFQVRHHTKTFETPVRSSNHVPPSWNSHWNTLEYVHNFQVDPFDAHLYSAMGMNILAHSLKTLYLDATGSVISNVPNQKKRILYYALTLPGRGRDGPPLPVREMISSEHSVPPIAFWLMQFLLKLSTYTTVQIHCVEMNYSWSVMQAVLLSRNQCFHTLKVCMQFAKSRTNGQRSDLRPFCICARHTMPSLLLFTEKPSIKAWKHLHLCICKIAEHCVCGQCPGDFQGPVFCTAFKICHD